MSFRPTLTFGICVAAGIAAGIGLARPGPDTSAPTQQQLVDAASTGEQPTGGAGGGYGGGGGGDTGQAQTQPGAITIDDFAYGEPITVSAGTPIEVTNVDGVAHTLTDANGAFDTGTVDGSGGQGSFTAPDAPGTYSFICTFHPGMEGEISVTG